MRECFPYCCNFFYEFFFWINFERFEYPLNGPHKCSIRLRSRLLEGQYFKNDNRFFRYKVLRKLQWAEAPSCMKMYWPWPYNFHLFHHKYNNHGKALHLIHFLSNTHWISHQYLFYCNMNLITLLNLNTLLLFVPWFSSYYLNMLTVHIPWVRY